MMKTVSLLVRFMILGNIMVQSQIHVPPKKNLKAYKWYGKRFDWILDLYTRQPSHRDSILLFMRETNFQLFLINTSVLKNP